MAKAPKNTKSAERADRNMNSAGREKAVAAALSQIRDKFGDGAIMTFDDTQNLNVESMPTGSVSLDLALGIGGIPKGRIIEVYGPEVRQL
jgi:recombination protein RecA